MIMESCYKVNHNKNTMAVIEEEDEVADTIHGEDEAVVGITTLNVKGKRTNKENSPSGSTARSCAANGRWCGWAGGPATAARTGC